MVVAFVNSAVCEVPEGHTGDAVGYAAAVVIRKIQFAGVDRNTQLCLMFEGVRLCTTSIPPAVSHAFRTQHLEHLIALV